MMPQRSKYFRDNENDSQLIQEAVGLVLYTLNNNMFVSQVQMVASNSSVNKFRETQQ